MTEVTKGALLRQFIDMARAATTDSEKLDCQTFLRERFLPDDAPRPVRQGAVLNILSEIATHFDGARYQIPETYETIMARIPEKEPRVRHAARKLAVNEGIIDAPGWGGK